MRHDTLTIWRVCPFVCTRVQVLHPHSDIAQPYWRSVMEAGDVVVDATCGNGWDTLFLLRSLAATGMCKQMFTCMHSYTLARTLARTLAAGECCPGSGTVVSCHD